MEDDVGIKTLTRNEFLNLCLFTQVEYINERALKYCGKEWLYIDNYGDVIEFICGCKHRVRDIYDYVLYLHCGDTNVQGKMFLD